MKLAPFLFALIALCAAPVLADDLAKGPPPETLYEARTFQGGDGKTLGYRLLKPQDYDAKQKYPLVVFLHGAGERGSDNVAQLKHGAPLFVKPEAREKYPCFVVAPQCPANETWIATPKGWTGPNPFTPEPMPALALVAGALEAVQKEFSIDPDRLYVTGLSMGGYGTWDLLTRFPARWAAAAPVCGGADVSRVGIAKSVPVWAFHGANDRTVPTERSREAIAVLQAAGSSPVYSEYPYVGHDSWNLAYGEPEFLPWLFAQKRGQTAVAFATVAGPLAQPPSSLCPGEGPMQSGLWFRALWKARRSEWAQATTEDQGAVVFFGDSITQGWASLAKDFPQLKVANRGISGDTTRGLRTRLQGDVLALHPKAVSILIGTNDLDQGGTPEVVAANLQAIVAELHHANATMPIVINKVMPRGAKAGFFPEKIRALNALYEEAFKSDPQVTFCDTWTLFDDGQGSCRKEEFPDMLHPNAAGYAKWTAALQPIFEKLKVGR